jgi:hypothetical protein
MRLPDVLSRLDRLWIADVGRMTMSRSTRFLAMVAGAIALIATGLLSPQPAEARHGHGGWRGHGWHGHGGWRGHGWHGHGGWRHAGWHRGWGPGWRHGHWGPGWRHARWHRGWRGGVWGAGFYPAVYARPVFAPPPVFPAAYMPPPPPPVAYGYGGYGYQSRSSYRRSTGRRYVKKASQPACVCKCCPETPAAANAPPAPSTIPGPVDK